MIVFSLRACNGIQRSWNSFSPQWMVVACRALVEHVSNLRRGLHCHSSWPMEHDDGGQNLSSESLPSVFACESKKTKLLRNAHSSTEANRRENSDSSIIITPYTIKVITN